MTILRATVAYDGSGFHGFAVNAGVRTVAGVLEEALATVLQAPVVVGCAGRTDRGVHARGQVISFDVPPDAEVDLGRLQHSINRIAGPEVAMHDLAVAGDDFDARFSARWRRYRYRVSTAEVADPLQRDRAWHVPGPLDVDAMNAAATHVRGEHDFSSFCRRPDPLPDGTERSLVRHVLEAGWERSTAHDDADLLTFDIRATSFCHQMVRSIVGTCVDAGLGRLAADDLPAILAARDRGAAGRVAPPHGLTLWDVGYS